MSKMFYKIGEVSELTSVNAATLRYWEREFPHLRPSKNRAGHRIYSQQDLKTVMRIKKLLYEEGYTITGAKKKLGKLRSASRKQEAKELAGEILQALDRQKTLG